MRNAVLFATAALACASLCLPASSSAAPATREGAASPAPGDTHRWIMVEAMNMMREPGGGERLVALCRRAGKEGYNGLLLWDQTLWQRNLPSAYADNSRTLKAGLKELNFQLVIKMCPRGWGMIDWTGDQTIVEPRPSNPSAEERNYRYICLAHPGVMKAWEEQLVRAEKIYRPDGWLLQYDELRVSGDDERCKQSGKTPAQLLAEHSREAIAMCRRLTPGRILAIWNDMFDPHHNAKRGAYYHVKEGWYGAWEGIDKDVLVLNWNDVMASYDFWSQRGNKQIFCGYYDGEMGERKEAEFVRQVRQRPGVVGYMYTTWQANFSALAPYLSLSGFGSKPAPVSKEREPVLFLDKPAGRK